MANKYDDDYTRVYWENLPSHNTPINQQNLNKMDAQIKTLTTRVSDMSAYIPNVMYVDELPEQGVEGLLYVTALIEHGFELDGLPNYFKSQSALDSWVNDGHFAFMLHIHTADPNYDDTYVIISDITVDTIESTSGFYEVNTIYDDIGDIDYSSSYYQYNPSDKKWYQHAYYGISVGDKLIAYNEASATSTKIGNMWYATDGAFDTDGDTYQLGIENIVGDLSIGEHISTHAPITYYTSASNTYEIYQAKPIRVLDPRNVYMWNDDTHSFFGFQKEYENGIGINFNEQGTHVTISADTTVLQEKLVAGPNIRIVGNVISATGGGGGGGSVDITQFAITAGDGTTVECNMPIGEIISKLNDNTLIAQAYIHEGSSITAYKVPLTRIIYGGGTTYDFYFDYFDLTTTSLISWKVQKTGNPSEDTYTATKTVTQYQSKLTEGDGIDITNGVISVNYPNGDTIAY